MNTELAENTPLRQDLTSLLLNRQIALPRTKPHRHAMKLWTGSSSAG